MATVTLEANTTPNSRRATIYLKSGGQTIEITVTQLGADENPGPDRPDVAPENRLTLIDYTRKSQEPNVPGHDPQIEIHGGYLTLKYDQAGRLVHFSDNAFDGDDGSREKLNFTVTLSLDWSQAGKMIETSDYFEIYNDYSDFSFGQPSYPIGYKNESISTTNLNSRGSALTTVGGETTPIYSYNTDGTLARMVRQEFDRTLTIEYTWKDGNIVSATETYVFSNHTYVYRAAYTYTDYPNPWPGVDVGSLVVDNLDAVFLAGIAGVRTKNLPASCTSQEDGSYSSTEIYTYTFDEQGRVASCTETSSGTGSYSETSEYLFHYGDQPERHDDYVTYLTGQEIADEGTSTYDDGGLASNYRYNSFVKIRNSFSDGSVSEDTVTRIVEMTGKSDWGDDGPIYIPAGFNFAGLAVRSTSLEEVADDSESYYIYTLDYTDFQIATRWDVSRPSCMLYSKQKSRYEVYEMPFRTIDKKTFGYGTPQIYLSTEGVPYHFQHEIWPIVTPGASPMYKKTISRSVVQIQ